MKKVICILLTVFLMLYVATPVFAQESEEPQYGTLKVEYSDALGNVERLDVMVKDDHVYADAVALSDRLGYDCTQEDSLVSIFAKNNFYYPSAPLLAVHFYVNENKVAYHPLFGAEYEYTSPAPCIVDEKGIWVPLTYTLVLLGGNSTMLEDTLLVQMPQNNVLSIAATIVNNVDALSFDWISHFGYSETVTNITDGAGRVVTLFSGLLEFDGDAWLSLLDWSAFDKKFGKSLATMFCTNSAEELQESIEQVELLLDVFSPEGKAGEMLRNKQIRIDSDVTAWKTACDEYLELLEQGSGSPAKYNMLYQQYERAVDDQSLFATLGGDDAIYIQNELSSAANVLDVASKVGSAVSYFREFQQKDVYQISVLKNYLKTRTPTDNMPDATADAMKKYLASTDNAGQYVFSRFLEENALELIVDKSGLDAYLGLPANILLFAWDIMSGTIPFYSEGLKAVENREISNYAQKMQNDALENLKYLIAELKKSSSISADDCVQLSEYCYVYLKACYIARSSAIKSLDNTSEEFREQIKGKLDVETDINQFAIQYMSVLSSADVENSCYILGFLPENNEQYLNGYSDDALLSAAVMGDSKFLTQVNEYSESGELYATHEYQYNGDNALICITTTYDDYEESYTYSYDAEGRLIEVNGPFGHGSDRYTYNDKNQIIKADLAYGWREYEYNEKGYLIRTKEEYDWQTYVNEYTYGENNTLLKKTEYIYPVGSMHDNATLNITDAEIVIYTYDYDNQNRIIAERWEKYGATYCVSYDYSYKPFTIITQLVDNQADSVTAVIYDRNGNSFDRLLLSHGGIVQVSTNKYENVPATQPEFFTDEGGYLAKVIGYAQNSKGDIEKRILEFHYDGESPNGVSFEDQLINVQNCIDYNSYSASQKEYCRGDFFEVDGKNALLLMYHVLSGAELTPGYYVGLWVENSYGTISCLTDQLIEEVGNPNDAYVTVNIRKIDGKMYLNPYVRKVNGNADISKNQYYLIGDELVLEYNLYSEGNNYYLNQEQIDQSAFYSTQDKLNIRTYILGLDPNWSEGLPPQGYTFEELLAQLPAGTTSNNSATNNSLTTELGLSADSAQEIVDVYVPFCQSLSDTYTSSDGSVAKQRSCLVVEFETGSPNLVVHYWIPNAYSPGQFCEAWIICGIENGKVVELYSDENYAPTRREIDMVYDESYGFALREEQTGGYYELIIHYPTNVSDTAMYENYNYIQLPEESHILRAWSITGDYVDISF